jgi:hypothetical protein
LVAATIGRLLLFLTKKDLFSKIELEVLKICMKCRCIIHRETEGTPLISGSEPTNENYVALDIEGDEKEGN